MKIKIKKKGSYPKNSEQVTKKMADSFKTYDT